MRAYRQMHGRVLIASVAALAVVAALAFAYLAGRQAADTACNERCPRAPNAEVLKDALVTTAELVLVHEGATLRQPFEIPPSGPFAAWAAFYLRPIFRDRAQGEFRYYANFQYGYDFNDRDRWELIVRPDAIELRAPPLVLIGCPAINLASIAAEIQERSIFVDEDVGVELIHRRLTTYALRHAESQLLDARARARIKDAVEPRLRDLITVLATRAGAKVTPPEVRISYTREIEVEPWPPDSAPALINERLRRARCGDTSAVPLGQ
jgi:hypothetical protein